MIQPAFVAALASGKPLRLDGRVYIVNGPLSLSATNAMIGVAGVSIVRRVQLAPSASWIQVSSPSFSAYGIIFDAGGMAGADMPAVAITSSCTASTLAACGFIHATGPSQGQWTER